MVAIIKAILIFFFLLLGGCGLPQGTRKITAWGIGAIPTGGIPIPFLGYWHSEHGKDVKSEQSAKPPALGPVLQGPRPSIP